MMKITVVLHNIRSTYNVGAILRTCEGLGIEKVVYSGYTPRYNDPALLPHLRERLNHQIAKSALGAETMVKQIYLCGNIASENRASGKPHPGYVFQNSAPKMTITKSGVENKSVNIEMTDASDAENLILPLTKWLKCAIMEGYIVIGLENNLSLEEQSRRVILGQKMAENGEKADFGENCVLILGEEVNGIPAGIRHFCDYFLEIPMRGQKESFNVSIATGIALWGLENCY